MKDPNQVILAPIVSEKAYALMEANQYTFRVHPSASKPEISDAVSSIFDVTVLKVNTLNRQGKKVRNRRTGKVGSKVATKRAIVTLSPGDSIDLFKN